MSTLKTKIKKKRQKQKNTSKYFFSSSTCHKYKTCDSTCRPVARSGFGDGMFFGRKWTFSRTFRRKWTFPRPFGKKVGLYAHVLCRKWTFSCTFLEKMDSFVCFFFWEKSLSRGGVRWHVPWENFDNRIKNYASRGIIM